MTPIFDKTLTRASSDTVLPSFMEGIHNRLTITCLNSKVLEMNNFDTGRFQSVLSSFSRMKESKQPFATVSNWNSSFKNEGSTQLGLRSSFYSNKNTEVIGNPLNL